MLNLILLAMGIVFLYHGTTKKLGEFSKMFKLPIFIASLVIFAEIAGGIGFLLGGFIKDKYFGLTITQWASLAVIPVLLGAISMVHYKNGFNFMDNGWEYQFVLVMVALQLLLFT